MEQIMQITREPPRKIEGRGGRRRSQVQTSHDDDENKSPAIAIAELTALGSNSSKCRGWKGGITWDGGELKTQWRHKIINKTVEEPPSGWEGLRVAATETGKVIESPMTTLHKGQENCLLNINEIYETMSDLSISKYFKEPASIMYHKIIICLLIPV